MKINQSLVIQQPASSVFACVSDFRGSGLWSSLIIAAESLSPADSKPGVGFCYTNRVKLLNQHWDATCQVVEFEPNRIITSRTTTGWLRGLLTYRLEPQDQATRLLYHRALEFEAVTFFKPFEAVLQKSLERQTATDLANLKDWLESGLYQQARLAFPS